MANAFSKTVLSEASVSGTTIELTEWTWNGGDNLLYRETGPILRWNLTPGAGRCWLREGQDVKLGQLSLLPENVPVHFATAPGNNTRRAIRCRFESGWLRQKVDLKRIWENADVAALLNMQSKEIDFAMRRLARELEQPSSTSPMLLESLITSIAVDVVRYVESRTRSPMGRTTTFSSHQLRQITGFIESYDVGYPTVDEVAAEFAISNSHLRHLFKVSTGRTLRTYIEDLRMARAKEMLAESDLPMKVIAHRLGYCHSSAFASGFKQVTAENPQKFRQRHRTAARSRAN